MGSTKEIIHGGVYITIASIIIFIFSYAFRILLTRNLSVEEYGLFYSVWNFLTFFLFFIYLGLDQAVIHYIVKYKTEDNYNKIKTVLFSTLFFQLITTSIFIVIIFYFSNYLEGHYFRFIGSGLMLKLMSLFLLFNVFGAFNSYIFYGFQRMKLFAFFSLMQSVLYVVFVIIFFKLNLGIYAPFLAYVFTAFALIILFFPFSIKVFNFFKYKLVEVKEIMVLSFSYGIPMVLTAISSRLLIQTDTLMLTRMTSLEQVGLYQAALPLATLLTFFSTGILTIIFPLFTELWHRREKERVELYLKYSYKYLFVLLCPLTVLAIFFSGELLQLMFGVKFLEAKMALIILLSSAMFNIFSSINLQSISAFGDPKLVSKIVLFGAGINIILNVVFIPFYGINGAAFATSLSYLLIFVMSWYYLRRYIALKLDKKLFFISWKELRILIGLMFGK